MPENKSSDIKKGFILVYTLLIGMLCILLALFCFEMLLDIKSNQGYFKGCILKVQDSQKGREYLLTEIKNCILSNVSTLTVNNITNFLNSLTSYKLMQWQNCYIAKYDLGKNYIYAALPYDSGNFIKEVYQYKIVDGTLKFKFVFSIITEGSLK